MNPETALYWTLLVVGLFLALAFTAPELQELYP